MPFAPGRRPSLVSPDGEAAYTVVAVPQDFEKAADWGNDDARDRPARRAAAGSRSTSPATSASARTSRRSSATSTRKLLVVTILLVLVLLGAIYRSPLIAFIPILVVGLALQIANGLIYLYAEPRAT